MRWAVARFEVELYLQWSGTVEVEADDAEAAEKKLEGLTADIDLNDYGDVDTSGMDMEADVEVSYVFEIDPEESGKSDSNGSAQDCSKTEGGPV